MIMCQQEEEEAPTMRDERDRRASDRMNEQVQERVP